MIGDCRLPIADLAMAPGPILSISNWQSAIGNYLILDISNRNQKIVLACKEIGRSDLAS